MFFRREGTGKLGLFFLAEGIRWFAGRHQTGDSGLEGLAFRLQTRHLALGEQDFCDQTHETSRSRTMPSTDGARLGED